MQYVVGQKVRLLLDPPRAEIRVEKLDLTDTMKYYLGQEVTISSINDSNRHLFTVKEDGNRHYYDTRWIEGNDEKYTAKIHLVPGELVLLKKNRTVEWYNRYNYLLGEVVTVAQVYDEFDEFTIEEVAADDCFYINCIERIATLEDIAEKEERDAKKEEEWKKKYPDLVVKGERVLEIAKEVFGEDRVDIVNSKFSTYHIIIRFPEFEITNRLGQKHTIRDLFFRVEVSCVAPENLYKAQVLCTGRRTSFTLKELYSNYSHSHLSRENVGDWEYFCLGASQFSTIVETLKLNMTEDEWYLFFYSIPSYLAWESVDTHPYIRISNIDFPYLIKPSEVNLELGRIAEKIPLEAFDITDRIHLIEDHPSLVSYLDKESLIRSATSMSEEAIQKWRRDLITAKLERLTPLEFKGQSIPFIVINDLSVSGRGVAKDVVDAYYNIIEKESLIYSKTAEYERRKKAAGKVRVI